MNNPTAQWRERWRRLGGIVIVPTYNNAGTLASILEGVLAYSDEVLVVNDGSSDDTASILARYPEVRVLTHPTNRGKGTALMNGLSLAQREGYRYAITIDSDGQHYPDDLPRFIEAIERQPDTLLVGERNLEAENMPSKNSFANKFSNFWYRLQTGIKLGDTQSGYRLYPLERIKVRGWYYTAKYEYELEAIVYAAWGGTPVANIPIRVYYPPREERVSHFRPLRDFTRISVLNTLLVLWCALWIWPRNCLRQLTWTNIKAFIRREITHSQDSNGKIVASVMLGIFMGIVPIWGYQMLVAFALAHQLRLNKTITLVVSNISIPPMMPLLLFCSYATGCWVLDMPIRLTIEGISLEAVKAVLYPYIVGSLVFATAMSLLIGGITAVLLACLRKPQMP